MTAPVQWDAIARRAGLKIGPSTSTALSRTGEPYITLTDGGFLYDGQRHAITVEGGEADAWARYEDVFRRYILDRVAQGATTIYWRMKPQCLLHEERRADSDWGLEACPRHYAVYSRLLATSLPRRSISDIGHVELHTRAPRKYRAGRKLGPMGAIRAILNGDYVYLGHEPKHPGWMIGMTLSAIRNAASEGRLRTAILNGERE